MFCGCDPALLPYSGHYCITPKSSNFGSIRSYKQRRSGRTTKELKYKTKTLRDYINNGGAVGDITKIALLDPSGAIAAENQLKASGTATQIAIGGASAFATVGLTGVGGAVGATATAASAGGGAAAVSGAVSGALTSAGVSATVPVVGWVIAGVLVAAAGGIYLASKNSTKLLTKDISKFKKYIKEYSTNYNSLRSLEKEAKYLVKELEKHLKTGDSQNVTLAVWEWGKSNNERTSWHEKKAKLEIQLDSVYFIMKERYFGPMLNRAIEKQKLVLARDQAKNLLNSFKQKENDYILMAQKEKQRKIIISGLVLAGVVTLYVVLD